MFVLNKKAAVLLTSVLDSRDTRSGGYKPWEGFINFNYDLKRSEADGKQIE